MVYFSLSLPIISSTNLQKTWTDKNNVDMFMKSDQEIIDEQAVYRPWHLGWEDLHTRRKHGKMVFMYIIVNHLILLRYQHALLFSLSVHLEQGDITTDILCHTGV